MPIAALPQETVRVLTSSLALNDAISVVKELIDNALDAAASSITIEISSNTLDIIQIKDNGKGIGIEDRQLLCKRGCTSKIRTIEDLTTLGGKSLGFRGEALASVASTSDAVMITTRIEGELVGTALKFGANGKILSSSSASHAVGTTVRVQNFLSNVPVRRQTMLKSTSKILLGIRKLLFAYAFARPETRFSFKVLKAKNDKMSWSYAPGTAKSTLVENAGKVIGKEAASQTVQVVSPEDGFSSGYAMKALLINSKSEIEKACNIDSYFSVDQRPITTDRDLMRDLYKMYKSYLRNSLPEDNKVKISKPFICLQLSCPTETYDVNVEPAKDRIMFYDQKLVSDLFEEIMKTTYGEISKHDAGPASGIRSAAEPMSFNVLLASPKTSPLRQDATAANESSPVIAMNPTLTNSRSLSSEANDADSQFDNPWTKARMNVRLGPKSGSVDYSIPPLSTSAESDVVESPSGHHGARPDEASVEALEQLLTPEHSPEKDQSPYQNPGPPMRRHGRRPSDSEEDVSPDGVVRGPTLLDGWMKAQQQRSSGGQSQSSDVPSNSSIQGSLASTNTQDVPEPLSLAAWSSQRSTPTSRRQPRGVGMVQKPFNTPFKRPRLSQFPDSPASSQPPATRETLPSESQSDHPPALLHSRASASELDEIMEFERQKRVVAEQRKRAMNKISGTGLPRPQVAQSTIRPVSQAGSGTTAASSSGSPPTEDFLSQFDDEHRASDVRPLRRRRDIEGPALALNRPVSSRGVAVRTKLDVHQSEALADESLEEGTREMAADTAKLSDSDPRSHLFRQHELDQQEKASSSMGLTRTGLKVRRVKTTRLPLETISPGQEVHDLAVELLSLSEELEAVGGRSSGQGALQQQAARLKVIDEYVISGSVRTVGWSSCEEKAGEWSEILMEGLKKRWPSVDGKDMAFEIAADLRKALEGDEITEASWM